MFRKKAKSIDDVKEILPNDLSDKSSDFNIVELENMVNDLENQIKNMKEGYENGLRELNMRIRSMEDDFKYVRFNKSKIMNVFITGNIGISQDPDTIFKLIRYLKNEKIKFYFYGNGRKKNILCQN